MEINFDELTDQWTELNELKSTYLFTVKPFDKIAFAQVVKDSLQAIKRFKEYYRDFNNHTGEIENLLFDFSCLSVKIAEYGAETFCADESEEYIFTASQAIARLLLNYATAPWKVSPTDDTGVLCGSNEDCGIYCPSAEDLSDDYWCQSFSYDTDTGDMTEILELVKRSHADFPF